MGSVTLEAPVGPPVFGSKENFLVYFLTSDFVEYKKDYYNGRPDFTKLTPLDKIVDIFVCCGRYNEERGVKYIMGFYSPKNFSLFPVIENSCSFTPLINETLGYLEEAIKLGELPSDADRNEIARRFCILFNGIPPPSLDRSARDVQFLASPR